MLNVEFLCRLYHKHAPALRRVRSEQQRRYAGRGNLQLERFASCLGLRPVLELLGMPAEYHRLLKPQLDDIEAETTYLLLRERRPGTVVEIAPDGGWSTTWLLSALRDNGSGQLFSYDIFDHSTRTVPRELAQGRWTFAQGDVTQQLGLLPPRIDYLFMDCAHSAHFARWYLRELFPRLAPETPICIHDIFPVSSGESRVVRQWLLERSVNYFTTAPAEARHVYERLMHTKRELGLAEPIHDSSRNPMVFFQLPQQVA
jgi:predicted O-methyltransferase YrrM